MNGQDLIVRVNSRYGRQRSYHGEKKRVEMRERVSKAISSFLHTLQAISSIWKFHAISLTARHVARENHFYRVLSVDNVRALIRTRLRDSHYIRQG